MIHYEVLSPRLERGVLKGKGQWERGNDLHMVFVQHRFIEPVILISLIHEQIVDFINIQEWGATNWTILKVGDCHCEDAVYRSYRLRQTREYISSRTGCLLGKIRRCNRYPCQLQQYLSHLFLDASEENGFFNITHCYSQKISEK